MRSILAMIGEWRGKVRSTPTPKLTLRTVNVAPAPEPRRAITTPSKTWTRSRLPSTTRTCTLTVSPGANSGTSSLIWVFSTTSVGFMVGSFGEATANDDVRSDRNGQDTRPRQAATKRGIGPAVLVGDQRVRARL